jgi:hypothetical protein
MALVVLPVSMFASGCGGPEVQVVDLTQQFADARKQPSADSFAIEDVTIDGQTLRAVVAREQTRLTYHVTVPARGFFRVGLALKPDAWTRPGNGVLFLVGISDGHVYREMTSVVIDPYGKESDRRWHELLVNLREYVGLTVDLILNTRAGLPPSNDVRNDLGLWGSPAIVSR